LGLYPQPLHKREEKRIGDGKGIGGEGKGREGRGEGREGEGEEEKG
jgi:hypothetical protein